ncbi:hypothetical protein [Micromonospora sp. IBHARD004]|uniref:hypothetical protein n=1 Tax=Micromonospora sp. IBHARD004 TaxID=3457764 RepID=UPI00405A4918
MTADTGERPIVNCPKCGTQVDHPGQGHTCVSAPAPVDGLPPRWQAALWALLALAVLFAGLSLVRAAIIADLIVSPSSQAVTVLSIAVPLALFFAFLGWSNLTKRVIDAHDCPVSIVRNWAVSCGSIILFLSYLLPMKTPAGFHLARAAGAILLIIGALITRSKLGRWLANPAAAAAHPGSHHGAGSASAAPAAIVSGSAAPQSASADEAYGRVNLPRSGAQIVGVPLSAEPRPEDWNPSLWDPEVQEDIERRRRRGGSNV